VQNFGKKIYWKAAIWMALEGYVMIILGWTLGTICCEVSEPGSGFCLMVHFGICGVEC
jgi:hypothetical protein